MSNETLTPDEQTTLAALEAKAAAARATPPRPATVAPILGTPQQRAAQRQTNAAGTPLRPNETPDAAPLRTDTTTSVHPATGEPLRPVKAVDPNPGSASLNATNLSVPHVAEVKIDPPLQRIIDDLTAYAQAQVKAATIHQSPVAPPPAPPLVPVGSLIGSEVKFVMPGLVQPYRLRNARVVWQDRQTLTLDVATVLEEDGLPSPHRYAGIEHDDTGQPGTWH